ncbi:hypothetical protein F5Y13DRAFT_190573 [Hypoxylon sp. FL1857]|nr:hypothetical protein F5Y13DRAFT_190573 [Hypoxylon sp. FL1857]
MASESQATVSFEQIQTEGSIVGSEDPIYWRILTSSNEIKYLQSQPSDPFYSRTLYEWLDFDKVPEGDWNMGCLSRVGNTDALILDSTMNVPLSAVDSEKLWHPQVLDWLDLKGPYCEKPEDPLGGRLNAWFYGAHLGVEEVIVHFHWHPRFIDPIPNYTYIYSRIDGHNIAPKFLAHITENRSRIIGYMTERIHGRLPTIEDLDACREVLSKFHSLGLLHGDLSPRSFIIDQSGRAFIHSFERSRDENDQTLLESEMNSLEKALRQTVRVFKPLSKELSDKIMEIHDRDGFVHPAVTRQAQDEGTVTVTEAEHKEMLVQFAKDGYRWLPESRNTPEKDS